MSRRRQPRTEVTPGAYWPHSDPEPPTPSTLAASRDAVDGDEPCPGQCNAAARRAQDDPDAEPVRFHPGRPVWCRDVPAFNDKGEALDRLDHRGCAETILDRLGRLPELATSLAPGRLNTPRDGDVDPSSNHGGGARALSHAPSPSPAWDTADELIRWLVALEDWLRDVVGDAPAEAQASVQGREYRLMAPAVRYLHGHGEALLASVDALQVGRDVLATYRRLEHLSGRDRLVHHITEPCPRCGRKGMRRKDGGELVTCSACRATWDWEHFEHLCRVYADSVKAGKGATA